MAGGEGRAAAGQPRQHLPSPGPHASAPAGAPAGQEGGHVAHPAVAVCDRRHIDNLRHRCVGVGKDRCGWMCEGALHELCLPGSALLCSHTASRRRAPPSAHSAALAAHPGGGGGLQPVLQQAGEGVGAKVVGLRQGAHPLGREGALRVVGARAARQGRGRGWPWRGVRLRAVGSGAGQAAGRGAGAPLAPRPALRARTPAATGITPPLDMSLTC